MIAVEIPAALAEHPEVVPVDPWWSPTLDARYTAMHVANLVGQRVALAWRETCPTCGGTGSINRLWIGSTTHQYGDPCGRCTDGFRMVVGWTAEVAEVVPIVDGDNVPEHLRLGVFVGVANGEVHLFRLDNGSVGIRKLNVGPADWSPGRYALVLRAVETAAVRLNTTTCRPFSGFAELADILKEST